MVEFADLLIHRATSSSVLPSSEVMLLRCTNCSTLSIFSLLMQIGRERDLSDWRPWFLLVFIVSSVLQLRSHLYKVHDSMRRQANGIIVVEVFDERRHRSLNLFTTSSHGRFETLSINEKKKYRRQNVSLVNLYVALITISLLDA